VELWLTVSEVFFSEVLEFEEGESILGDEAM
jgi:hypothetical protein